MRRTMLASPFPLSGLSLSRGAHTCGRPGQLLGDGKGAFSCTNLAQVYGATITGTRKGFSFSNQARPAIIQKR